MKKETGHTMDSSSYFSFFFLRRKTKAIIIAFTNKEHEMLKCQLKINNKNIEIVQINNTKTS